MKLLVFSDIHNNHGALERLMDVEADCYIAAGDLVSWSRGLDRCGEILRRRADKMYILPGNHESAAAIAAFCRRFGFQDFHEQSIQLAGFHVAGLGYSNPTPFNTPGEYTEQEIELRLERFANLKPLILICHCPPLGTALDRIRNGLHAGSRSVKTFIEKHQPVYFFCGHIHEAEGASAEIGKTCGINVGQRGYLLDFAKLKI
jgi:uncharacterized protein